MAAALDRPRIVFALYVLATLVLCWPLSVRIGTHLPLSSTDLWLGVWDFWWWRQSLFELGTSPYFTDHLFFPHGISLAFTDSALNVLATLPISLAWGVEAAYDVALLAGFQLAAFFAYLLVRHLVREPRAAFLAGLLYGFTPMHFEEALDHVNAASVQFAPLFVLTLLRTCREGGRGPLVGLALAAAANALASWYWAVVAAGVGLALVLRELLARDRPRPAARVLRDLAVAAALAAALVLPFAWPLLRAIGEDYPFHGFGVDPAFWFVPSEHNPVLGSLTKGVREAHGLRLTVDHLPYLGLVPVVLATLAALRPGWGGPRRGLWAGMAVVLLALAVGTPLTVLGRTFEGAWTPYAAFEHLPLLGRLRTPSRFQLWAFVPLAVLCGGALAAIFRGPRPWLGWALGAAIVVEYLWLPFPTQPVAVHPYYRELARDPEAGAVLPIPLPASNWDTRALHDQTVHGRPIVGGTGPYHPAEVLRELRADPFLDGLARNEPVVREPDPAALARLGIGTVVVHLDRSRSASWALVAGPGGYYHRRAWWLSQGFPDAELEVLRGALRRTLGAPSFRDERIEVFRVPHAAAGGER
jgi:hypothetical protein